MLKWFVISSLFILVSNCSSDLEKPEKLLSTIDGEDYYNAINGEMNTKKATLLILENNSDSVNFDLKIDVLDSLETADTTWRKRYLLATNQLLPDLYEGNKQHVQKTLFSFLIHYPEELITHLDNDGFTHIDLWMKILSKALYNATQPEDITSLSVANVAIRYCENCSKKQQELIVSFIKSLENFTTK